MLITKIHISNFKNFGDVEVNLGEMSVIVGANASGKSNFIKALKFIKDIKESGIDNAISMAGGIEYLRNIQSKNKSTSIEIHFQPNGGRVIDALSPDTLVVLEYSSIIYKIEISSKKSSRYDIDKEEIHYKTKIKSVSSKEKSEISEALEEYDFTLISKIGKKIIFSNPVKEDLSIELSDGKKRIIKKDKISPLPMPVDFFKNNIENETTGNKNTNRKTLLERYPFLLPMDLLNLSAYDFDLKKAKESTPITGKTELEENGENLALVIRRILEDKEKTRQFSNLLTDVLPFIKNLEVEKFYDKSLLFKVKEDYNSNAHIPSSLLSDGTISVTAIITALFFEDKELTIFEEPEQGIHPALIAKLMQLFYSASEKKQVIITTHSPEILKHTILEDLLLVSRNENGFATISKPKEQTMVNEFLANDLGIDLLFTQNLLDA